MRGLARGLVVGAVLAGLAAGAVLLWPSDDGAETVPTYRVEVAAFRREVPADGSLKAVKATPITAPQESRMPLKVAWVVKDGTRVKDGEVVIRFDPAEMKDRLRDGRDSSAQVRKRIAKEGTLAATAGRKRMREASAAESEMQAAESREYTDNDLFSRNEIIESQIDKDLASARMKHARSAKHIERSVSAGKLEVLKVQARKADLTVSRAEKALSNLELTAPHDGIFLLERDWRGRKRSVGDTVWPGQKIAEVPQDGAMEAEIYVLEADGGTLEVGMKATLVLQSRPELSYKGSIKRVETLAKPRVPEVPVQYFGVTLSIEDSESAPMKIGQRVDVRILLEETEALAVPRQAVFSEAGTSYVYRQGATGFDRVEVELGVGTAGRVTVNRGLSAGDVIALRAPSRAVESEIEALSPSEPEDGGVATQPPPTDKAEKAKDGKAEKAKDGKAGKAKAKGGEHAAQ